MSRDTDDHHSMTRRDLMGSAGTVTSTGLLSKYISDPAQAQTQSNTDPRMQFGSDWEFIEVSDGSGGLNLRIRHIPSGETFTMQSDGTTSTRALDTEELRGDWDHLVSTSDDLNSIIVNDVEAGDVVQLTNGTHVVTKSTAHALDINPTNITIRGMGKGVSTIKLEDNASDAGLGDFDESTCNLSGEGVTLKHLTIDGNRANNTTVAVGVRPQASDYTIENVEIKETTGAGIGNDSTPGTGGTITDCHVHDGDKGGFHGYTPEVTGRGNTFENFPNQDGVEPLGDNQTWEQNTVRNCVGSAFDCVSVQGVEMSGSIIIQGESGPANAFEFQDAGSGTPAQDCVASENIYLGHDVTGVSNSAERLVQLGGQKDCKAVGNIEIGTHTPNIINEDDFVFKNNTVKDKVGNGIGVRVEASGASVEDNYFRDNSGGFDIEVISGLSNVSLVGNDAQDSADRMIKITGGSGHTVRGNTADGCPSDGILLAGCSQTKASENTLIDCGSGAGDAGIRVDNPEEVVLTDNKYDETDDRGIVVQATDGGSHTGVIITGEQVVGPGSSTGVGIDVGEPSGTLNDVRLSDNDVRTSTWFTPYDLTVSGVLFRNGTEFVSGAPTASDYIAAHVGNKVIDESASPPDEYYVNGAGSLTSAL